MKKTLAINLFAPPSSGKTTLAAALFAELKMLGINAEYVQEYAKTLAWRYAPALPPANEIERIPVEQAERMFSLIDKVDVIVTDAPLKQSSIYQPSPPETELVWNAFDNINIYVERTTPYEQVGRWQTEEEAAQLADKIKQLVTYDLTITGDRVGLYKLVTYVLSRIEAANK